jgi:hypothetical protein
MKSLREFGRWPRKGCLHLQPDRLMQLEHELSLLVQTPGSYVAVIPNCEVPEFPPCVDSQCPVLFVSKYHASILLSPSLPVAYTFGLTDDFCSQVIVPHFLLNHCYRKKCWKVGMLFSKQSGPLTILQNVAYMPGRWISKASWGFPMYITTEELDLNWERAGLAPL